MQCWRKIEAETFFGCSIQRFHLLERETSSLLVAWLPKKMAEDVDELFEGLFWGM
jgi:hypothetical protein